MEYKGHYVKIIFDTDRQVFTAESEHVGYVVSPSLTGLEGTIRDLIDDYENYLESED